MENRRSQSLRPTSLTRRDSLVEAGSVSTLGHGAILAIDTAFLERAWRSLAREEADGRLHVVQHLAESVERRIHVLVRGLPGKGEPDGAVRLLLATSHREENVGRLLS